MTVRLHRLRETSRRSASYDFRFEIRAVLFLFSSVLLVCLLAAPAAADDFKAGAAMVNITPPIGWRKAGGYDEIISSGVHDPLYAKALVFEQGEQRAALVFCDLTGISRRVADRARAAASEATGIPIAHIVILATHTHGAPEYHGVLWEIWHRRSLEQKGRDDTAPIDYQAFLAEQWVQAIREAWAVRKPVRLHVGIASQPDIAFNRRYHMKDGTVRFNPGKKNPDIIRPAGPVDTELPILLLHDAGDGRPLYSLTVFAMHVATFFKDGQFGADFPAVIQSRLRAKLGPKLISVFGEGTAGDINHFDVYSAAPQPGDTEPERIGSKLAETILKKIPELKPVAAPSLAVLSEKVSAPLQEVTPEQIERAEAVLSGKLTSTPAFMLQVEAYRILHTRDFSRWFGDAIPMEVQAFRLGTDTAIVTLPHEIFADLGLAIKRASPFTYTFVISLANDVDWYVPTRKAFAEGSYEVTTCPVKPGSGEMLVECASRLLNRLKP
jgi:neutral ceramidase